jgi:hypothetical protein
MVTLKKELRPVTSNYSKEELENLHKMIWNQLDAALSGTEYDKDITTVSLTRLDIRYLLALLKKNFPKNSV